MAKRRPSGDGMVRKRGDGRWEGRIVVGHKENGEPIFRYVLAKTQKELLASLASFTAGFKLAWGLSKELEADGLYSFDEEETERVCRRMEQEEGSK